MNFDFLNNYSQICHNDFLPYLSVFFVCRYKNRVSKFMEPINTLYLFNKIVFEHEEGISELIYVTKEKWKDTLVTPETLCSSMRNTPTSKATKELKDSIGVEFKKYIPEKQAYEIFERIVNEEVYSNKT